MGMDELEDTLNQISKSDSSQYVKNTLYEIVSERQALIRAQECNEKENCRVCVLKPVIQPITSYIKKLFFRQKKEDS